MAEDDEIDILGDFSLDNFLTKNDSGIYENASLVSQSNELLNCDYTIHPQWLLDKPSANPDCWYDTTGSVLSTNSEKPADFGGNESEIGHVSTENAITDESGWTEKEKNLLERGIEIFGKSHTRLAQFIGSRKAPEVKYYLKNFYLESQSSSNTFNSGTVEDMNGVNNLVEDILDDTQIPASIEEVIAAVSTAKPTVAVKQRKKTVSVNSDDFSEKKKGKVRKNVKFKIKAKLKFPMHHVKQKRIKVMNQENRKAELSRVEITTGKGLSVPICEGEEIVKISKDNTDSDIEIDVEEVEKPETKIKTQPRVTTAENESEASHKTQKTYIDISILDDEVVNQLTSLDTPKCEKGFELNVITELEKVIHCEFFEGRPTKTPLRYLKIRTHIINAWNSSKPNYVTKTSVRHSLKNCGDVNCISRIHCLLEQTGAINFGCPQTTYIRPLLDVFQGSYSSREKPLKDNKLLKVADSASFSRIRRKLINDGEGGRTLAHNEKGDVINTTIVNEDAIKPKTYFKKPSIRLIYCRPFAPNNPQPITVKLNLTTLLLMDFHAHTSLSEVMGLICGKWSPETALLTISGYEPCKNAASSATHCDMCPISQSKAADLIQKKGLDILGWFHSHPTFAPEPSQQDLETQQNFQMMLGSRTPCLGVILSPFSLHGALIASPFRCLIVDKKEEDQFVPYKLEVDVVSNEEIEEFLKEVKRIFASFDGGKRVDFKKSYFQDNSITYLEKFITSVRMHLAKCGNLNKMTCDYIIDRVSNICTK